MLHSAHVRGLAVSPGNQSESFDGLRLCLPLAAPHRKCSSGGRAETIIAFQKKVAELLGIPLKPFEADEIE